MTCAITFSPIVLMIYFVIAKHDEHAAKEYISYLALAVQEKVTGILVKKDFMSLLTDGSQARKTGDDKEMVLLRIEHNGIYSRNVLLKTRSQGSCLILISPLLQY